jgi:hypothetical protein
MYVLFIVYPVEHEPLNVFLTTIFERGNVGGGASCCVRLFF